MAKRNFRIIILICAIATLALVSSAANAEPIGDLPPLSDYSKQVMAGQGKSVQDMKDAIPSKEMVGIPVFPGALYCTEMTAEGMLPTVVLASEEPVGDVKTWYLEQEGLTWSEQWGMFYVGDEYVMMQSEAVLLQDISDDPQASACGMAFDMKGMKTQFSISYEPKINTE